MKRILKLSVIIIFIFSQYLPAQGWQWIETGYPFTIYDICFPPGQSDVGFAAGSNSVFGIILKTTDGGFTWVKISDDSIPGLRAVCFPSTDVGFVGGEESSLMKTTDGGLTWTTILNKLRGGPYINNIEFWDINNGIVISYTSTAFVTTDGGASWNFGFGIKQTVEDICYADANTLYLVGGDEMISKSTNGGFMWTDIYTGTPLSSFYGVDFYNADYGIVSGQDGKMLVTTDGGVNWTPGNAGGTGLMSGVYILNEQTAFTAGSPEQVFKSTDGGLNWVGDFTGGNLISLYKIKFTDNLTGIICGADGKFLINTDYVPVELTGFTAALEGNDVRLNWTTATETNNKGFVIERSDVRDQMSDGWKQIGFVEGNGTTTITHSYSFKDRDLTEEKYNYRLKQIDFDGSFNYSNTVEVAVTKPAEFSLEQNYPNPFNPSTQIKYNIPGDGFVSLKVFNCLGQQAAVLVNGYMKSGYHVVTFNASELASGVYYYRLNSGNFSEIKKMTLMK